jgi:hypothetical protein
MTTTMMTTTTLMVLLHVTVRCTWRYSELMYGTRLTLAIRSVTFSMSGWVAHSADVHHAVSEVRDSLRIT